MKLGCSRVACQINMSPTSAPLSVVQSLPPADYLPSSPSSFSTPALPRRFSSPFFVNLPHTTTDVALPPRTLTLSRAALPLPPVPHPFRLQDGLIRNKIIVLFARTCFWQLSACPLRFTRRDDRTRVASLGCHVNFDPKFWMCDHYSSKFVLDYVRLETRYKDFQCSNTSKASKVQIHIHLLISF